MRYYAFEYWSATKTTSGHPNLLTGRMNIAGELAVFSTKAERDTWVNKGSPSADRSGYSSREPVTAKQARNLHLGMSVLHYTEMVDAISPSN